MRLIDFDEINKNFGRVQIKIGLLSCLFEFYAMVFELSMLIFIISFKSFQSGESTSGLLSDNSSTYAFVDVTQEDRSSFLQSLLELRNPSRFRTS